VAFHHVKEELKGPLSAQNAFTILMHTQYLLSQPSLPSHVLQRTNKHKMYSDAIDLQDSRNLKFSSNEVAGAKTLVDVLWYQHHGTLIEQSCPIPSCFANFVGYNKFEQH